MQDCRVSSNRLKYQVVLLWQCIEKSMFTQFRVLYPQGSLITELSAIDHGQYIVRCLVQVEGKTLVTALASAQTVELAEEQARSRALAILGIETTATLMVENELPLSPNEVTEPAKPTASIPTESQFSTLGQMQLTQLPLDSSIKGSSSLPFAEAKVEDINHHAPKTSSVEDEKTFLHELSSTEPETSQKNSPPLNLEEEMPPSQLNEPVKSYFQSEPETDNSKIAPTSDPIDMSEVISRTTVEVKRLGWTNQQGKDYLLQTYGKRSRQLLTDEELLDFLNYLESQPTPEDKD